MGKKLVTRKNVSLARYSTLRAGGKAELFAIAENADQLAAPYLEARSKDDRILMLGHGSNILVSDDGVPGMVLVNRATKIEIEGQQVYAEAGCALQELFLKTVQRGLVGLEFGVGIPGSLGGALVSNAGAYRNNVSAFVTEIEVVEDGVRKWVDPSWMEFSYRDSKLRQFPNQNLALIAVRMRIPKGDAKVCYDDAREYQRQRIGKQPSMASAGSFFKNVNSLELAERLPNLPAKLKEAGVVPAGFIIEQLQLKGFRIGNAGFARRHANFIVNLGGATAREIRSLAEHAKMVADRELGVTLEEEVLYMGDWSRFEPISHPG